MTDLPVIPFGRVIRLGSRGNDTEAVKRALARAGYGTLSGVLPVFGLFAVLNLRAFQKTNGLRVDGEYGPLTHARLVPWFDRYCFLLYTGKPPPPPHPVYLQLPKTFIPTHETSGLPGYPAVDVFAAPETVVLAPNDGTVRKLSGHDPAAGGHPGGPYGWSIYLACENGDYFLTHFATRTVTLGQRVRRAEAIGTVCDAKHAHMPSSLSHIHEGLKVALLPKREPGL